VGLVVEGARDEDVEVGIAGLARGDHQVGAGDGAEFWADEMAARFSTPASK